MDKPQSESSSGDTESEGSSTTAQEAASALLRIEPLISECDSQLNDLKLYIVESLQNCNRCEQQRRSFVAQFDEFIQKILSLETNLAEARWKLADMNERARSIDRRRPNDKRKLKRQILGKSIAETEQRIINLVDVLSSEKNRILTVVANLKSIQDSVYANTTSCFMAIKKLKRGRQGLIALRNEILGLKKTPLED